MGWLGNGIYSSQQHGPQDLLWWMCIDLHSIQSYFIQRYKGIWPAWSAKLIHREGRYSFPSLKSVSTSQPTRGKAAFRLSFLTFPGCFHVWWFPFLLGIQTNWFPEKTEKTRLLHKLHKCAQFRIRPVYNLELSFLKTQINERQWKPSLNQKVKRKVSWGVKKRKKWGTFRILHICEFIGILSTSNFRNYDSSKIAMT